MATPEELSEDFHATTLRLPRDVYEAVRRTAFEQRISQQQLVIDAIRSYLFDMAEVRKAG